jgi:hypothetical protein
VSAQNNEEKRRESREKGRGITGIGKRKEEG